MKSKKSLYIIAGALMVSTIGLTIIGSTNVNDALLSRANKESYSISFSSSKNKFHSYTGNTAYDGNATIQTNLGNNVDFSYYQVKGIATTWHVLGSGGYFYNTDPIHGLESIILSFKTDNASFDIYYSNDDSFDQKQSFVSSTSSSTVFNFNNYLPNYFKIVNTSDSNFNISAIDLTLSCERKYPTLTISSEDETMGTVSGGGIKAAGDSVTITASPKPGHAFVGWYDGSTLVSSDNPYTFNMPFVNTTYTAKFSTNIYDLTLNTNNSDLGLVSGAGSFAYGSSVTITATPNTGVSFLGWYDSENNLVSSLTSYTFNMPHEDLEYTAKFEWTPYTVAIEVKDDTMGSVTGAGSYTYGQEVNLVATPNEHHSFFGWYLDGELVSREETLTFNMPNKSINYETRFVVNHYIYVHSDDETMGTVSSPAECGEGLEVTVTADASIGYAIDYWYDDDLNEVSYDSSYTFTMPNHDVSLYAAFTTGYTLTLTSSDVSKGTVTGGGQYKAGRSVTAVLTGDSYSFKGWYDKDNNFVSILNPYTFIMPSSNYALFALLMTTEEEVKYATKPILSENLNGKTITYGLYPQTNVDDSTLVSALNALTTPEPNGWYLYEDEYYAKVSAKPYKTSYTFNNGTTIVNGTTYWFKCEPIRWNVLSNNDGEYYILSSVLLDTHCYDSSTENRTIDGKTIYPNNYEHSDVRTWLNNDFYNSAFALGNSHIQITTVDNSATTTNSDTNPYTCDNTNDKVFLPSYKDYIQSSYGFWGSGSGPNAPTSYRYCKTTDWTRAKGAYYDVTIYATNENGIYYARSPDGNNSDSVLRLYTDGRITSSRVEYTTNYCVRPAITIKIDN